MFRRFGQRLVGALPASWIRRAGVLRNRYPLLRQVFGAATRWMRTVETTIAHGPGAGLIFNPGGANPGYGLGTNEPAVQAALATHLKPGDVFYDIGANVGFHTVIGARLVGPAGRVVAFEPIPSNAGALRRNLSRNDFANSEVIEGAVSSAAGHAIMLLGDEPTWARLADAHGSPTPADRTRTVEVETFALDDLIAAGRIPGPDVVKIDAEGAEIDVLKGMARTLRDKRPIIVCELHGTNREVAELLRAHHYDLTPLESDEPIEALGYTAHVLALPQSPAPAR